MTNLGKVSEFYLRGDVLAAWHGYFVITVTPDNDTKRPSHRITPVCWSLQEENHSPRILYSKLISPS